MIYLHDTYFVHIKRIWIKNVIRLTHKKFLQFKNSDKIHAVKMIWLINLLFWHNKTEKKSDSFALIMIPCIVLQNYHQLLISRNAKNNHPLFYLLFFCRFNHNDDAERIDCLLQETQTTGPFPWILSKINFSLGLNVCDVNAINTFVQRLIVINEEQWMKNRKPILIKPTLLKSTLISSLMCDIISQVCD